jgi:outer membrane protein OmpA-like peptidoglycan-associated protein
MNNWKTIWTGLLLVTTECVFGQPGRSPQELYRKGLALQQQAKFDSAGIAFQEVMTKLNAQSTRPGQWDVEKRIAECESGRKLLAAPRNYIVTNLGPGVNTAEEEYAPAVDAGETMMVFTSRRLSGNTSSQYYSDGRPYEDVWMARSAGGAWTEVQNMGKPINNAYHNSAVALSADGKHIYLYTDEHGGDILVSDFNGTQWITPQRLPYPINTMYRESSVTVSADGKKLIVASERPGGLGGSDLYLIEQHENGSWLPAKNLGPSINTEWDEDSPFLDNDGLALYFSSRGHDTMGGFDLFRSLNEQGAWTPAMNLGSPINTPHHDSYWVSTRDGKRAYFASERPGGYGKEDIYLIQLPVELQREVHQEVLQPTKVVATELTIHFAYGASALMPASLDSILSFARQLPAGVQLQIDGHTDAVGTELLNDALARRRAEAVRAVLQQAGIATGRIRVAAWGSRKPRIPDSGKKEKRPQNRRVEVRVINN